jgi:multidrug efflux pump subunit AcrA (membrane-fusion protein)
LDGTIAMSRKVIIVAIVALALAGGGAAWLILSKPALPPGFAGVNGRLEAKQVDIATKYPGRIKEVADDEGDTVDEGQIVATVETRCFQGRQKAPSFGVSGKAQLLPYDRTKVGGDISSNWDWV